MAPILDASRRHPRDGSSLVQTEFSYRGEQFRFQTVSAHDHLTKVFADTGTFYELDLLEYVRRFITCDLAVDVGANIGNHSVYLRRFVAAHVVSIEPYRTVLPSLHANVASLTGITVCEVAVGSHGGKGRIQLPGHGVINAGAGSIVEDTGGEVPITTLDALLADRRREQARQRVGLIKIDVEGSEVDVLKGAHETLREDRPDLLIEAATPAALQAQKSFLEPLGYGVVSRWAITPVYHFRYRPDLAYLLRAKSYRTAYLVRRGIQRLMRSRRIS